MLVSQRSLPEHNPKFSARKNFPIAFYPTFFFHHYDWNRWFASLATTVDNTIKIAERSFKHGRQWCMRRIGHKTSSFSQPRCQRQGLHCTQEGPQSQHVVCSPRAKQVSIFCRTLFWGFYGKIETFHERLGVNGQGKIETAIKKLKDVHSKRGPVYLFLTTRRKTGF